MVGWVVLASGELKSALPLELVGEAVLAWLPELQALEMEAWVEEDRDIPVE